MHNIKPYTRATDEQKANYKPSYTCVEKINFSGSKVVTKMILLVRTTSVISTPTDYYKLRQWPTWCTLALFYNTSITFLIYFTIRPLYSYI